jgi:CheY-like chemotaxis protein
LGQVVPNLLVNAAHASEEGNKEGNVISVSSSTAEGNVVVRIGDTGHGMSKDVRRRALEPFFTTKKAGVGTGLGLALCVDIVSAHGGTPPPASHDGVGTTVHLHGPIALAETGRAPTDQGAEVQDESPARILCIDDEKLVLRTYRRCISRKHDVVLASGGREALAILQTDQRFDLIVCDMMMPNLDGPSVYQELTRLNQALADRLVFCTGGAFTKRSRDFLERWNGIVLNKPVDRTDLSSALQLIRSSAKS